MYEDLYDAYKQWCIRNGEERRQLRANILGANLRKYELISEKRRARVGGVRKMWLISYQMAWKNGGINMNEQTINKIE